MSEVSVVAKWLHQYGDVARYQVTRLKLAILHCLGLKHWFASYKRKHFDMLLESVTLQHFSHVCDGWYTLIYTSVASCETGWIEGFKSCYKFLSAPATWGAAPGLCSDVGGNLVVVDNMKKSAFITGFELIMVSEGFLTAERMWCYLVLKLDKQHCLSRQK